MGSFTKEELVDLIYECPADIAVEIGYEKMTDLHSAWIRDMVFGEGDKTLQAHRGSFKTTCIILAFAFICILFPSQRTIFLRKTDTDVAEVMKATANVLGTAYFKMIAASLYGVDLRVTVATMSAVSTNLISGVSGASQILGLGCGGSITGKHADRVFTDDIINVRDRVSPAERERIKLIYQELQNIKNRGGRIFNTGTPWHKDDAFTLMPNIVRFDCYQTGLMSQEEIEHIRASMSVSLFAANYELKHIADEEAMFGAPAFTSELKPIFNGIGHVDASYGGKDGTAFTVLKRVGELWYVYGRLWQKPVDDCLPEILRICKALKVGTVFCERNADKGYLVRDIRKKGHPAAGYAEEMNKYIKIATYLKQEWANIRFVNTEAYPFDGDYINQILDYNEFAAHDDAPDSLASAIRQYENKPGFKGFKEGI